MSPRVMHDPTDFEDSSDALGELRFEFESSAVGVALLALVEALHAVSKARGTREAMGHASRRYVPPMGIEERGAERLLNILPELAEFTEKLVQDQYDIELEEQRRLTA